MNKLKNLLLLASTSSSVALLASSCTNNQNSNEQTNTPNEKQKRFYFDGKTYYGNDTKSILKQIDLEKYIHRNLMVGDSSIDATKKNILHPEKLIVYNPNEIYKLYLNKYSQPSESREKALASYLNDGTVIHKYLLNTKIYDDRSKVIEAAKKLAKKQINMFAHFKYGDDQILNPFSHESIKEFSSWNISNLLKTQNFDGLWLTRLNDNNTNKPQIDYAIKLNDLVTKIVDYFFAKATIKLKVGFALNKNDFENDYLLSGNFDFQDEGLTSPEPKLRGMPVELNWNSANIIVPLNEFNEYATDNIGFENIFNFSGDNYYKSVPSIYGQALHKLDYVKMDRFVAKTPLVFKTNYDASIIPLMRIATNSKNYPGNIDKESFQYGAGMSIHFNNVGFDTNELKDLINQLNPNLTASIDKIVESVEKGFDKFNSAKNNYKYWTLFQKPGELFGSIKAVWNMHDAQTNDDNFESIVNNVKAYKNILIEDIKNSIRNNSEVIDQLTWVDNNRILFANNKNLSLAQSSYDSNKNKWTLTYNELVNDPALTDTNFPEEEITNNDIKKKLLTYLLFKYFDEDKRNSIKYQEFFMPNNLKMYRDFTYDFFNEKWLQNNLFPKYYEKDQPSFEKAAGDYYEKYFLPFERYRLELTDGTYTPWFNDKEELYLNANEYLDIDFSNEWLYSSQTNGFKINKDIFSALSIKLGNKVEFFLSYNDLIDYFITYIETHATIE